MKPLVPRAQMHDPGAEPGQDSERFATNQSRGVHDCHEPPNCRGEPVTVGHRLCRSGSPERPSGQYLPVEQSHAAAVRRHLSRSSTAPAAAVVSEWRSTSGHRPRGCKSCWHRSPAPIRRPCTADVAKMITTSCKVVGTACSRRSFSTPRRSRRRRSLRSARMMTA